MTSKTAPFDCLFSFFHFPSSQFFFHLKICLCLQNNLRKHCFKNQHNQQLLYKDIFILSLFSKKVGQFCWSPYENHKIFVKTQVGSKRKQIVKYLVLARATLFLVSLQNFTNYLCAFIRFVVYSY